MKIGIDINNCSECPHHMATPYPTSDSFERPEYWWCKADDDVAPNASAEERRLCIKEDTQLLKLRYIAGYVEWNDKTPIPEWCPCKVKYSTDTLYKMVLRSNVIYLDGKIVKNRYGKEDLLVSSAEITKADVESWDEKENILKLTTKK